MTGMAASPALSTDELDGRAGRRPPDERVRLVFAMERKVRYAHGRCQVMSTARPNEPSLVLCPESRPRERATKARIRNKEPGREDTRHNDLKKAR
jgi:hypothetical protein